MTVEVIVCKDAAPVVLFVFDPSAGAGAGVVELRPLMLAYIDSSTLDAVARLVVAELPPQYSALFPGQGLLQLARSLTAPVPASNVFAQ